MGMVLEPRPAMRSFGSVRREFMWQTYHDRSSNDEHHPPISGQRSLVAVRGFWVSSSGGRTGPRRTLNPGIVDLKSEVGDGVRGAHGVASFGFGTGIAYFLNEVTMRPLLLLLPIAAIACKPCGDKIFSGGEALISLTVTSPDEVETTWVVKGRTKKAVQAYPEPGVYRDEGGREIEEDAFIHWPRGPGKRNEGKRFIASLPVDDIPGLDDCLVDADVDALVVGASWDQEGSEAWMALYGPARGYTAGTHDGTTTMDVEDKVTGSFVARDLAWHRITDVWVDCLEEATLTVSWELDRSNKVTDPDSCGLWDIDPGGLGP